MFKVLDEKASSDRGFFMIYISFSQGVFET